MTDVRFESFGLKALLRRPPQPMGRIHHHQEVEFNYLFSGRVTYLYRGELRRLEPGRLTVFWGAMPHSLVSASADGEMAWLTVPLAWILGWGLPEEFMRNLLRGEWAVAPARRGERFPVRDWVAELADANEADRRRLLLELQACLLWLAQRRRPAARARGAAPGMRPVEDMARVMAERFQEDLSVAAIAAAAKLHPNYAMTLFRRACGVTIRDYLQQHRLARAQQLLLTTEDKVIDVALASGFGSASAFYSAFGRTLRETPEGYRQRMRL